jgi:hypothetical protein
MTHGRPFDLGPIDAENRPANWDQRAPREPNYHLDTDSWVGFNPRVIAGELQGRWAADRIFGGGLWLLEGICWWVWTGTGFIDYARQEPTFAEWQNRRTYRHVRETDTHRLRYELTGLGEVRGQELGPDGLVLLSFLHQWSHPTLGMTVGAFA